MPFRFATTSWTQVLAARDAPPTESRQALEGFRQAYWHPVYAFVRRQAPWPRGIPRSDPGIPIEWSVHRCYSRTC